MLPLKKTLAFAFAVGICGCDGGNGTTTTTSTGGQAATGGVAQTGGTTTTGGVQSTGGVQQTGGVAATGGVQNTGGTTVTGGRTQTGGIPSTGGITQTGGSAPATGGVAQTGGTTPDAGAATGGRTGTGGTSSDGGVSPVGGKFVGNITTSNGQVDIGSLKYKDYWNQVSPQNEGKWGSVSSAKGQYNWSSLDTLYKYTEANNMIFKQHTFVWGAQQPTGWSITEADVKDWMVQFCKRYPKVKMIDVVNEPPPHTTPSYANAIGGGTNGTWAWIANSFKWAREACPDAILILNDYNNIEWDKDNQHFIDIVTAIKKLDAPIDAIGCQAHDLDHTDNSGKIDVTVAATKARLDKLIATIPHVYITELDLSTKDDALQLQLYKDYFTMFWNEPTIKGITIWGWVVGRTWNLAPDSGLITSAGVKRPAFTWLLQTIGR